MNGLKKGDDAFFFAESRQPFEGRQPFVAARIVSDPVVRFAGKGEKVGGVVCNTAKTLKVRMCARVSRRF